MALDPQIQAMDIPQEWKVELARWAPTYQKRWLAAVQAGNQAEAQSIVAEARQSPWQYNSAGQLYPNQSWFGELTPEEQQFIVTMMNDPAKLRAALTAAQQAAAANPGDVMAAQQLRKLTEIFQHANEATIFMNSGPGLGQPPGGGGPGGGQPPAGGDDTGVIAPTGAADQGMYSQEADEAARADPRSFVGYVLGKLGADSTGNNPLSASALRKATLFPYQRELMAGGYQNAPLYTFADALESYVRNNAQPGRAGGGTGTAFTMGQGNDAIRGLLSRASNKNNLEYDALNGESPQDALSNIKTYLAAGYADSMDPTYQRALQSNTDRQFQGYMDSVYGGNDQDSFVDYYARQGTNWMR